MWFIVAGSPYRHESERVIGPFDTKEKAYSAWHDLATAGMNTDGLYAVIPAVSLADELAQVALDRSIH